MILHITNTYATNARAFQSDLKRGTVSNTHIQTKEGAINSPLCHQNLPYKCNNK